jgi:hypothetical protein
MTTTAAQLWLGAAAFELVGLVLVAAVRPDPKRIAALMRSESVSSTRTGAPIGELLRQPGVVPALLAAQASLWVIVSVLTLIGSVMLDHSQTRAELFGGSLAAPRRYGFETDEGTKTRAELFAGSLAAPRPGPEGSRGGSPAAGRGRVVAPPRRVRGQLRRQRWPNA